MDYARLIAFCDVDATRLATRMKGREKEAKGYRDFREVLARPDIDVVHLCTPPHWHGPHGNPRSPGWQRCLVRKTR